MLTIESAEEQWIAEQAIAEFRKSQIRHVGVHAVRMNLECEQTYRERAFAEQWREQNNGRHSSNTLVTLLCTEPGRNAIVPPARAHFGSFYLWGDVAMVGNRVVCGSAFGRYTRPLKMLRKNGANGSWFAIEHGSRTSDGIYGSNPVRGGGVDGQKTVGHVNIRDGHTHTRHLTNQRESDAVKQHLSGPAWFDQGAAHFSSSSSSSRKAASAQIAKIPLDLSRYVAQAYRPRQEATI